MKLHRLTLTNYRGITHRDLEFPDHGVVVISGANEIGKSSMLEALDLLLEAKDRSTKTSICLSSRFKLPQSDAIKDHDHRDGGQSVPPSARCPAPTQSW